MDMLAPRHLWNQTSGVNPLKALKLGTTGTTNGIGCISCIQLTGMFLELYWLYLL